MAKPVLGKSLCSDLVFLGQDFAWKRSNLCIFVLEKAGKFNICNQDSDKRVWKLSFSALKLPAEAKKIEIFPKFQRWMKKMNIF